MDAALILQYDAGFLPSLSVKAEVNGDGVITVVDAQLILQLDAGLLQQL
jgi:hypothetical protein